MARSSDNARVQFTIDKTGFCAESAMLMLVLASLFQVIGRWGQWTDRIEAIMMIALPVVSYLLLALCILLFGRRGFFLSSVPVLMGVVFFIFKLLSSTSLLHTLVCILLYLTVAIVYPATVFGWIRTKWLLPPLFGLPLVYRIFAKDLPRLSDTVNPVSFSAGMQEMSILFVIAALCFVGLGLRKREPEPKEIEPEIVEPEPEPAPEIVEPAAEAEPAPAEEIVPESAPEEETEPAPMTEEQLEAYLTPAPEGSVPALTLEPEPWEPEASDGQGSADEQ